MKKATITFLFSVAFCTFSVLTLKGMDTNIQEVWKDIPGFEGYYQASYSGKIRLLIDRSGRKAGIRRQCVNHKGYLQIGLTDHNSKVHSKPAHRFIAFAWIPNPERKPYINHKNGNKKDNSVPNLEWCTASENMKHCHSQLGHKTAREFLSKEVYQMSMDGFLIGVYKSLQHAEKETGIKFGCISRVALGKRKHAGGYRWSY
jgi:hypothetical protein